MNKRQKAHIAKLIRQEVGYFNGWSVSEEQMEADIAKAAEKISKYVARTYVSKSKCDKLIEEAVIYW